MPAGVAGDKSAQRWANNGRDQRRPGQGGNRLNQLVLRCGTQYRQPANGHHQRAAYPLQNTHRDEHIDVGRQPAKYRRQGKNRQRESKDFPRAKTIGDPAAGRYQNRKGNKISANPDIEVDRRHAKIFRHVGQGGGYHRAVEKLHKKGASHQQRRC